MRRVGFLAAALALLAFAAFARSGVPGNNPTLNAKSCTRYVGPADLPLASPVQFFWGLRAVSCAYANTQGPAVLIRRASDDTTATINVTKDGDLDVTTAGTFCAATTCFVATMFEQVAGLGQCTLDQGTSAKQPQLIFNFSGSTPAMLFVAAGSQTLIHLTSTCLGHIQPINSFAVAQATATSTNDRNIFASAGLFVTGDIEERFATGTSNAEMFAGSFLVGATTLSVTHSFQFLYNDPSTSRIIIDGAATSGPVGGNILLAGSGLSLGSRVDIGNYFDGYIMEYGISYALVPGTGTWNLTQAGAMRANEKFYWGTP